MPVGSLFYLDVKGMSWEAVKVLSIQTSAQIPIHRCSRICRFYVLSFDCCIVAYFRNCIARNDKAGPVTDLATQIKLQMGQKSSVQLRLTSLH